jgi:hypothetical protein
MNPYWSYVLTAVGVFGLWLAGRKNLWGWAVGLGAQVLWIAYAYFTDQPGFYISALAYGTVYARNLRRWAKERREEREGAEWFERVLSAPPSAEALAFMRGRLRRGDLARKKTKEEGS